MTTDQFTYLVFGIVLVLALVFDLGLLSKKNKKITIRQALYQTFFWVGLALAFFIFMWVQKGEVLALQYLSGYLMEWSLSIDNIFIFILIFSAFSVKEKNYSRVLLAGILMAIFFRIIFITVGVALVEKFSWILYIFGVFLVYTGYKMFIAKDDEEFKPEESKVYKWMKKILPLVHHDGNGKYVVRENGKKFYTSLFVVVIMLAAIDLVFALDSIPAVMGISRDKLVIYTSNIFAVLGLRAMFFMLAGVIDKFYLLQKGLSVILFFIGAKMLLEIIHFEIPVVLSFAVIIGTLTLSIVFSILVPKKAKESEELS